MRVTGSITAENKVFDGTTAATLATMQLSGMLAGDNVAAGTAPQRSRCRCHREQQDLSPPPALTLTGAKAGDYMLVNPVETATASITPLTISGSIINDMNADGSAQAGEAGLGRPDRHVAESPARARGTRRR